MSEGQSVIMRWLERFVRVSWWLCIASPLVLIAWMMLVGNSHAILEDFGALYVDLDPLLIRRDMMWIVLSVGMGLVGAWGSILGYGFGSAKWRSVRGLLVWMAIVAAWFGAIVRREDLAWWGVWCRARVQLASLETFAKVSEGNWWTFFPDPSRSATIANPDLVYDRSLEGVVKQFWKLVPKNFYTNRNTTIVMFGRGTIPGTQFEISSIERTEGKAMRLELSGSDNGYWLERRWDAELPRSFAGGLSRDCVLQDYGAIGRGWYLVRYRMYVSDR